jgi:protein SCO1
MSASAARIILILSSFVVGVALALSAVVLVTGRDGAPLVTQASAVGGPFRLVDGHGRTVTDEDLKGKPFLVFFGFTHCPDVCPATLFEISEIFRHLGKDGDRAAALFITVDPERDTPTVMRDYLANFDPRLKGLTGDAQAIQDVVRAYRAYAKKVPLESGDYTVDHTALVYLMDKQGRFVAPFNVKRDPEAAAADLRKYF